MSKRRIYIAGPYTTGNQPVNTAKAIEVWHELADMGAAPYCPHLSMLLDMRKPRSWEFWIEQCLEWLPICHALYRVPGESKGADLEVRFARSNRIPVFHSLEEVREWLMVPKPAKTPAHITVSLKS